MLLLQSVGPPQTATNLSNMMESGLATHWFYPLQSRYGAFHLTTASCRLTVTVAAAQPPLLCRCCITHGILHHLHGIEELLCRLAHSRNGTAYSSACWKVLCWLPLQDLVYGSPYTIIVEDFPPVKSQQGQRFGFQISFTSISRTLFLGSSLV